MRKTIDENGNVSYELTLRDRIHDHLWITLPIIILLCMIGFVGYWVFLGRYSNALTLGTVAFVWWLFFYMAWIGPRM